MESFDYFKNCVRKYKEITDSIFVKKNKVPRQFNKKHNKKKRIIVGQIPITHNVIFLV